MNIFCSKAAICTDPKRYTRFIPETEFSELIKFFYGEDAENLNYIPWFDRGLIHG